jgi:hypothetical protein
MQVGADGPVAGVSVGEWIAVDVSLVKPGEVTADTGGVGAAGVVIDWRLGECRSVASEDRLEGDGQRGSW